MLAAWEVGEEWGFNMGCQKWGEGTMDHPLREDAYLAYEGGAQSLQLGHRFKRISGIYSCSKEMR